MSSNRALVAIGGNSLIKDSAHRTVEDQYLAMAETDHHIANLIADGWDVCITHGNGPQVGFILRRSELAAHELHEVPLEVCGADTQGAIGYALQQNLGHDFRRLGIDRVAITVVTQVEVDPNDPAFENPTKPIGSVMNRGTAEARSEAYGWAIVEEVGRGWRRVVPSPWPKRIVEAPAIKFLLDNGYVVIAAGGGGIPVVADENGDLYGVGAVVDKDLASALLAEFIEADTFLISTSVDQVALHWGTKDQRFVQEMTLAEVKGHLEEGIHFGAGSMEPKMRAVVHFLEHGGQQAVITSPDNLEAAMAGGTGTRITC
jgi:carbamate kinase